VPKQWTPAAEESLPEEARHKMLAFSRRILNGGEISREIVHALESQVRHYGPIQESAKALGIGYTCLGEKRKAEEFLLLARKEAPNDPEALHSLLDVLFSMGKFSEAAEVGQALVDILGARVDDEDVGRLALSYLALGKQDEACKLLDNPDLDPKNHFVKQGRRKLNKHPGFGLRSLFGDSGPLHRLLGGVGKDGLKVLTHRAGAFMGLAWSTKPENLEPTERTGEFTAGKAVMEYWVYSQGAVIPQWEDIQTSLAESVSGRGERERVFSLLESLVEKNDLTIDYLLRSEGNELFDYPEELIPQNAWEFSEDDKRSLLDASLIVRLRLAVDNAPGIDYVFFMMRFVEAVRSLTNGVVQDAVSHTLWGTDQWKRRVASPRRKIVDTHVRCELLDEGVGLWIHTHGMQKFGFPELEMEGVPRDSAAAGRGLMLMVAETLVRARDLRRGIQWPMPVAGTSVILMMEAVPKDDEDHFPIGSLKITPCLAGEESTEPEAMTRVFAELQAKPAPHTSVGRKSNAQARDADADPADMERKRALQEKLLDAHRKARENLMEFKKSFQRRRDSGGHVHAVKIGFPAQGGTYEWMWVSLDAWRGKSLVGYLENTPVLRKDLSKGSRVQLNEGEIFDWVIAKGSVIIQGAYTEDIVS
jgi:uncharacterized protein YegJ (DUF2314 family)/tetratricopeptide (TPR) repeat protein